MSVSKSEKTVFWKMTTNISLQNKTFKGDYKMPSLFNKFILTDLVTDNTQSDLNICCSHMPRKWFLTN